MGNASSKSINKAERETLKEQYKHERRHQNVQPTENVKNKDEIHQYPINNDNVMKKSGPDGLLDMGFEYRLVRCKDHEYEKEIENDNNDSLVDTTEQNEEEMQQQEKQICFECVTKLFHVPNDIMITATNRCTYIPDGTKFDDVSTICQEIVQERLQKELSLKFVTLCNDVTRGGGRSVQALVDIDYDENHINTNNNNWARQRPVFIFIGGKGKSRAGVHSVKESLISGIERGSTLFHLKEAKKRNFAIVCLDQNAFGESNGMDIVDRSLTSLFQTWRGGKGKEEENGDNNNTNSITNPVYILAHSAAGGYLVRYLVLGSARKQLFQSIHAIAFTDSTHRLSWAKDEPKLYSFLQSKHCLYIRNDMKRGSQFETTQIQRKKLPPPKPGESVEVDKWWCHRFGNIPTVWAGTKDHSAMCWVARDLVWDLFDKNPP